jgi:hypothetical protein
MPLPISCTRSIVPALERHWVTNFFFNITGPIHSYNQECDCVFLRRRRKRQRTPQSKGPQLHGLRFETIPKLLSPSPPWPNPYIKLGCREQAACCFPRAAPFWHSQPDQNQSVIGSLVEATASRVAWSLSCVSSPAFKIRATASIWYPLVIPWFD